MTLLCACLALGLASSLILSIKIFLIIISIVSVLFVLFSVCSKKAPDLFFIMLLSFIAAGRLLGAVSLAESDDVSRLISWSKDAPVVCEGEILSGPEKSELSWRMDVSLRACAQNAGQGLETVNGTIRLFSRDLAQKFEKGDYVKFMAAVSRARQFKNPGSFDYRLYLKTQGIDAVGSLSGPRWIMKTGEAKPFLPLRIILGMQKRIEHAISLSAKGDEAGFLKTIILSERSGISKQTKESFARTGAAHILAISGLHVGFLAAIVFFAARLLLGWWPRLILKKPVSYISALVSIPVVWLYVAIAGHPFSALRAAIMLTVFALASISMRYRNDLLSSLAAAVFAILLIYPASLFSVSFQLSVFAVFAIIIFAPRIIDLAKKPLEDKNFRGKAALFKMIDVVAVTLAAAVSTAPLIAYYFHYVTGAGIAANVAAVPFFGFVVMPLSFLAAAGSLIIGNTAVFLWKPAVLAASAMIKFVQFLDAHAGALVFSWVPSASESVFIFAAFGMAALWRRLPRKRLLISIFAAAFISCYGYSYARAILKPELKVTFFDVGQGDSIAVQFPNGRVFMIDGGGIKGSNFDIGEYVVAPALLSMGVRKIDRLILTHPHHDHYKGLGAICERFRSGVLYTNGAAVPEDEKEEWEEFMSRVNRSGVEAVLLNGNGDAAPVLSINEGGAVLDLYSLRRRDIDLLDPNDASLIARLKYKNYSFLFTGDLMEAGEQIWMRAGADFKSDVLKLGHHGSRTSTGEEFLKAVSPKIAVVTAGENNKYGFPDDEVLNRLKQRGIKIYRTDLDGAITITTDGTSLKIDTFVTRDNY
jgi:competence protein ComEC